MDWFEAVGDISYVGVILAVVASYFLGFGWYHWPVFGKSWAAGLGMTKEQADDTDGLGLAFAISLVAPVGAAVTLASLMVATGTDSVAGAAVFGAVIGLAIRGTATFYHYGFARISLRVAVIDVMHDVVQLAMMGAIIGVFN